MVWIKWQPQDYEPNQFLLCLFHFAYNQNNISFKVVWHGLRRFLWNPMDMCNLLELGKISSECKQQLTAEFEFSIVCFHSLIPHFELLSCLKNLSDFFFTVARCDVPSTTHYLFWSSNWAGGHNIPDVIWIILLLVQYTHQGSNTLLVQNLLWCIWS